MWVHDQLLLSKNTRERRLASFVPDNLLISCPADRGFGGIVYINSGSWLSPSKVTIIDRQGSMGLYLGNEYLLRVIQPGDFNSCIVQYHKTGTVWTMTNDSLSEVHDVIIFGDHIWVASTGTNEIARMNWDGSISKKIMLPGERDSWHVNCFDLWHGRLVATCFGRFDTHRGWKGHEANSGFVFDVESQEIIVDKLTMPHTPRLMEDGTRFICNSGAGALLKISPSGDRTEACFPGHFCRGMAIGEQLIYVGLSERRDEQLPIQSAPKACVAVLERTTLKVRQLVTIPFREIYDIIILSSTDQ